MKSMRKMVLAGMVLLASVMFLVGCDTNAGGGDNEVSNTGSNAGGGGNEEPNTGTYIKPMLPESSGKDPFEGKTLLICNDELYRFKVDTSSKTLVCQILEEDSTSNKVYVDYVKWTYSYDNLTDTPIITLRYESMYDLENGKVITIPEYIDLSVGLISEYISDEVGQKMKKYLEDLFSRLATYAITLEKTENDEDKIVFEGKYDSNYTWYDQITGGFSDSEGGSSFNCLSKYITVDGKVYSVTSITGDRIHCEGEGETKTFSYEKSQIEHNSDMTITVTIGDKSIPCIWKPDTFVALPPI